MLNLDLNQKRRHIKNVKSKNLTDRNIIGLNSRSLKLKYILEKQSKLDVKDKISNMKFDKSSKILKMQGSKVKALRKGNFHVSNI